MGRKTYIENEDEYIVKISDFKPSSNSGTFVGFIYNTQLFTA